MARIAITGSTGLIGEALVASLEADGHTVQRVTRSPARLQGQDVLWSPDDGTIEAGKLEGVDAVVHLGAEPPATGRLTEERKRRFIDSRRVGTRLIAETVAGLDDPPTVLVSQSATGYYGDRGDEILTEAATTGDTFMAEVCRVWESSAEPARAAGIRVVHPRTGVVMARRGNLIEKVELPFKLGVGGRIGSGRAWVPWISLADEVRALRFLVERDDLEGPVNVTSPEPAPNAEFTRALGEVMRRPTVMVIPPVMIRLLYGKMSYWLAIESQRVVPEKLLAAGFEFTHPDLRSALVAALGEPRAA